MKDGENTFPKEVSALSITADLIRGNTETIILAQLLRHDSYGYEINKTVRQISDSRYELKEATLYSAFRRLEDTGQIESYCCSITTVRVAPNR